MSHTAKIAVLGAMLEALVIADAEYLRENPTTPRLYASGVVYKREAPGRDKWQDLAQTIEVRSGDCEDLCAWRVGELRAAGEAAARCDLIEFEEGGVTFFHVVVVRGDGSTEDPSRLLGMH